MHKENLIDHTIIQDFDQESRSRRGKCTARLSMLRGPDEGRTFTVGEACTIGRGNDATVSVKDRGVSRAHARLKQLGGDRFVIEDLGSRNGTLVNGKRIAGEVELASGSRIQLGSRCVLLFTVHDELEELLVQAKKMEVIGRVSAGINHDFNNLLCVVLANATHLLDQPQHFSLGHAEVRECLEDMRQAAQSGAELTARLATLVRGGPVLHERVDVSELCTRLIGALSEAFPRPIRIEARIEPGIEVRGVRSHLWQMLLNPCLNARDAMPKGGVLRVEAKLASLDELEGEHLVLADAYAVLTFQDTGTGMTGEVLANAFEPFFTTKEIDLGRGLGLAIVRKVVSEHGGTVRLQSELDRGTTLQIILPVADPASDGRNRRSLGPHGLAASDAPSSLRPQSSLPPAELLDPSLDRRVLVIAQDQVLARALGRALRRANCDTIWEGDWTQALDLFDDAQLGLGAVLLDLDAAAIDPIEACAAIQSRRPDLPIVLMTNASETGASASSLRADGQFVWVRKPMDPVVLARVVATAVRRRFARSEH